MYNYPNNIINLSIHNFVTNTTLTWLLQTRIVSSTLETVFNGFNNSLLNIHRKCWHMATLNIFHLKKECGNTTNLFWNCLRIQCLHSLKICTFSPCFKQSSRIYLYCFEKINIQTFRFIFMHWSIWYRWSIYLNIISSQIQPYL